VLDHVKFTVTDLEASKRFYERALAPLGYRIVVEEEGYAAFGAGDHAIPDVWMSQGERRGTIHVALRANRSQVDAFHEAAVAAGATDNGPPGVRPHYHENYYAAFVHDLDGNNIEAVAHTSA
jgi:catechol 2,3-dioxygenase-like lactoylglutathione lyase family enzyme